MTDEDMADEKAHRGAHKGLGRGLSALLGDEADLKPAGAASRPRTLPIAFLSPNRFQPRRTFREEDLNELADSIKEKGVLQPIVVRPGKGPDAYEIVAGERRWRAAQLAKLHEVPVTIREVSDAQALEIAIIENVQRADLNAIEEALAYQSLMTQFRHTQEQLSGVIGKSRSHIANTLRLLKLPDSVQSLIAEGKLTAGHGRTLVGASDPEAMARQIIEAGLNVREAEKKRGRASAGKKTPPVKDSDTKSLERSLSGLLGLNVSISYREGRGGDIVISYKTLEQLDDVCRRLGQAD